MICPCLLLYHIYMSSQNSNKTHTKRENITRNISITHVLHFIKKLKYVLCIIIYIFNIIN